MHCFAVLKKCRSSMRSLALVSLVLATGTVFTMHLLAQTSGSGSAGTTPDAAPSVTLSVVPMDAQVGHRPGARSYYSTTVSDDKLLKSVVVTTSNILNNNSTDMSYQCSGKTFCEEKSYTVIPSTSGENFVTVTATDSAGQVTTKTVTFQAVACTTDAECGSTGSIQWAGASFCGSESGGPQTSIMQYGVGPMCKSGGICDTSSTLRLKQACPSGQLCTFGDNGINMCINPPPACTIGNVIAAACTCGGVAFNFPKDWRSNTPTRCCANTDGSLFTVGGGECPSVTQAPPPPPLPFSSSSSSGTASRSTLTPLATAPQTNPSSAIPSVHAPATTGLPANIPPMLGVPPLPFLTPLQTSPAQVPALIQSTQPSAISFPTKRLKIKEILVLKNKKKKMLRELKSLYAVFVKAKNEDVSDIILSLKEELDDFKPRIAADLDTMTEFEDALKSLHAALAEGQK